MRFNKHSGARSAIIRISFSLNDFGTTGDFKVIPHSVEVFRVEEAKCVCGGGAHSPSVYSFCQWSNLCISTQRTNDEFCPSAAPLWSPPVNKQLARADGARRSTRDNTACRQGRRGVSFKVNPHGALGLTWEKPRHQRELLLGDRWLTQSGSIASLPAESVSAFTKTLTPDHVLQGTLEISHL